MEVPVTMGHWGHLVVRPESGIKGILGRDGVGGGSHEIVPINEDEIKVTYSGSNTHKPFCFP